MLVGGWSFSPCFLLDSRRLTCFRYHSSHPRTQVVHLSHATPNLARVVRTVGLPLTTARAPLRTAVCLADKHVFAVKAFKPWAIRIHVYRCPRLSLDIRLLIATSASSSRRRLLFVCVVCLAVDERHQARVADDGHKRPQVGRDHDEEDDKVQDNHPGTKAGAAFLHDIVLHCSAATWSERKQRDRGPRPAGRATHRICARRICMLRLQKRTV